MAIKQVDKYFLGALLSNPKVYYTKIKEMIDAINDLTDGTIDSTNLHLTRTLEVDGVSTFNSDLLVSGIGEQSHGGGIEFFNATAFDEGFRVARTTVTQLTNITTAVTANAPSGVITTVALTTAGGSTSGPFTVNNSYVSATSTIILTAEYASGKTGNPIVMTEGTPGSGTFKIKIGNGAPAATVLNDVVKIHFLVV